MSTHVHSEAPAPAELDPRRALRLLGRALRLRCPNCGGGAIFLSFGRLRPDCPTCGLQLDRGESDYFLGAYLFNLVAVELLFAGALLVVMLATWPSPPWDLLQWGGAALRDAAVTREAAIASRTPSTSPDREVRRRIVEGCQLRK